MEISEFINRWKNADGSERANYQLFLTELTELLELPRPDPGNKENEDNAYVFERRVRLQNGDGSFTDKWADFYRRGCFICEAKQTGKELDSKSWDTAMLKAHGQAQQYARALPTNEGRPPFILVTDVGRSISLYAEFSRSGGSYVAYPDPQSYRIRVEDLETESTRELLRAIWLDPLSLDPARQSAIVTREIADQLAKLAKSLEDQHEPDLVAAFLMRCLFTMFAETPTMD